MKQKVWIVIGITIGVLLIISALMLINGGEFSASNTALRIGSTTSLQDSGLWDLLIPIFETETGIKAKVIAVGTGQALQLGKDGEVDVLVIHDKNRELLFVSEGHGIKRYQIMENDFVLVGPSDNEQVMETDILKVLKWVATTNQPFISRGDDSGTHQMEKNLWRALEMEPSYSGYQVAGAGMGAVLQIADEQQAYTLTDRATFNKRKDDLDLKIISEGDPLLTNLYGALVVNPNKNKHMNSEEAETFIAWLLSEKVQAIIGDYGVDDQGKPMFLPSYEVYP